ncbi:MULTISPECIES: protein kinase domain-containing protein [Mycolicibacterium]|jgi:serine/threonine-protein kinase|nr:MULTISPECIES: protein kinase [Mycolicibacterium]MCV7126660.1 serine/threonine protein kinase [Mycolicibacterium vanbaalenii PYR-1]MDW5614399.1 protein kinase [Mycolicibacterium sp. D5.8-2]QZY44218.1 protein kinase [Mycolicibacterium austroafricanum]UJL27942.1 serine/threonine protein kinase [Mycolicibacterium vanbaalenii]WND54627.1 protein kinase [Mycolicibacterium vanbaalenii]
MNPMETYQRSSPLTGAVLDGRYRVDSLIATGGMSAVYRGLDQRLDRPVALKIMDSRYAGDQDFLTRFQREARAVARLKDPGLVAVYDQGIDGQHPFLVMELVEGGTLRELLRERGPMPPHAVAAVLRPVLSGLAAAHSAGLVHRDIKPENVLISDDGEVKIADFGLVRAVAEAKITSTSVILGTAAYLSPEQVATGETDSRGDVYSVGILVYELLTGRTPFTGDTALAVAYQRMDRDVAPPSTVIDGVPRQFDDLVLCATSRDPADRFADAAEMAEELETIVRELALPQFRVPAPRNSALHNSANTSTVSQDAHDTTVHLDKPDPAGPVNRDTRVFSRDELPVDDGYDDEYRSTAGRFAGIELDEFYWARQRSRRVLFFWVVAVITLAALAAAGAWTLGTNLSNLL